MQQLENIVVAAEANAGRLMIYEKKNLLRKIFYRFFLLIAHTYERMLKGSTPVPSMLTESLPEHLCVSPSPVPAPPSGCRGLRR